MAVSMCPCMLFSLSMDRLVSSNTSCEPCALEIVAFSSETRC
jgi:hypothetical protein